MFQGFFFFPLSFFQTSLNDRTFSLHGSKARRVQYAEAGLCYCTYQPKTLLISSDSVLYDLYIMSVLNVLFCFVFFQEGDVYVQFVFCVINERFKPSDV